MNVQPQANRSPNGVLATAWLLAGIVPASAAAGAAPPAATSPTVETKPQDTVREPFDRAVHPLS